MVGLIRTLASRGIIAAATASGEVIASASAFLDPMFRDRPSVQASKIEAVLCVPIIQKTTVGVLYLQGRPGGGRFSDAEIDRARTCSRHLAPLVETLFIRSRHKPAAHVAPFKKRLALDDAVCPSAALPAVFWPGRLVAPA